MRDVKQILFQNDAGDDGWQALVSLLRRLVSQHPESGGWELACIPSLHHGSGPQDQPARSAEDLARSAYEIEQLLTEPSVAKEQRLVFLKTFNQDKLSSDSEAAAILRELRVCSLEQPALRHDGVCRISLATHAAAVETEFAGYGRVGLRARLPFVALEYCEGLDLCDFATPDNGLPAIMRGLTETVSRFLSSPEAPAAGASDGNALFSPTVDSLLVIDLLQAISTSQEAILGLIAEMHAVLRKEVEEARRRDVSKEAAVSSLASRDAADLPSFVNALAAKFDSDLAGAGPLHLPAKAKATRAARQLCQHLSVWDWRSAARFLSFAAFAAFLPSGLALSDPNAQEKLHRLAEVAGKERESAGRLSARLGELLLGDRLCLEGAFHPKQRMDYGTLYAAIKKSPRSRRESAGPLPRELRAVQLEDALLIHMYAPPGKARGATGRGAADGEPSCPASVAWAMFQQAAEAVAELHACGIAHCDIKPDNFVLTVEGRTKLVDFGFLLELHRLGPVDDSQLPAFAYSSPEFRQVVNRSFTFAELAAETGLTPAELFKANDVWMLGQTLFFLLLFKPSERRYKYFGVRYDCDALYGWEALEPDRAEAAAAVHGLGLPAGQAEALAALLFDRVLVPVRRRLRDARAVLAAVRELDAGGWAAAGQAELLRLLWPYFAPSPELPSKAPGKGRGPSAAGAVFEADVKYVKVAPSHAHVM